MTPARAEPDRALPRYPLDSPSPPKDGAMNGREHLAWCVERAMEYAHRGDMANAWASFGSDCLKHPATAHIPDHELYGMEMLRQTMTHASVRDFQDFISGWSTRTADPA